MAKIVRFWRALAGRLVCTECGASSWSIVRMNYETKGRATCDGCGARAVYYRRGRSQPNAAVGAVKPESLLHHEDYIEHSANEWLAEAEADR